MKWSAYLRIPPVIRRSRPDARRFLEGIDRDFTGPISPIVVSATFAQIGSGDYGSAYHERGEIHNLVFNMPRNCGYN